MLKPVTTDLDALKILDDRLKWLSAWTIHHANHVRENDDGLKVGGHQASCTSMGAIMAALYFHALGENDRVAVKPHAGPVLHAIHYLLGTQTREQLENFRGFGGAQSYPSRTKDGIPVDFSTGSVGLGVAITLFASLVQDYLTAHGRMVEQDRGRFVALIDDAELDEGNIYEALIEGAKHDVRNLVDRRLQPPGPRRDQRRPHVRALRRDLRKLRLAGRDAEVRQAPRSRVPGARRQGAARLDRSGEQRRLCGADLSWRQGVARAA